LDDPDQMAEERRLRYVGLTRAEDRLFLTYAFVRTRYGDSEPSVPSRFLEDIPAKLLSGSWRRAQRSAARRATTWQPAAERTHSAAAAPPRAARAEPRRSARAEPRKSVQLCFHAGQRVRHASFGEGLVVESRADRGDEMVTVIFEEAGLKRLMASIARLDKLDE
jgi:DNA helicase-2/ATP-dependent DNA helicase PcrA